MSTETERDILAEVQEFLEAMHYMPPEWTVEQSQTLHAKVQAARAQQANRPSGEIINRLVDLVKDAMEDENEFDTDWDIEAKAVMEVIGDGVWTQADFDRAEEEAAEIVRFFGFDNQQEQTP